MKQDMNMKRESGNGDIESDIKYTSLRNSPPTSSSECTSTGFLNSLEWQHKQSIENIINITVSNLVTNAQQGHGGQKAVTADDRMVCVCVCVCSEKRDKGI